jgi:hypothetical protein
VGLSGDGTFVLLGVPAEGTRMEGSVTSGKAALELWDRRLLDVKP